MKYGFTKKSGFVPIGQFDLYSFDGDYCKCPACKILGNLFYVALSDDKKTLILVCSNCNEAFRLKEDKKKLKEVGV
jgi:hypothetical protein